MDIGYSWPWELAPWQGAVGGRKWGWLRRTLSQFGSWAAHESRTMYDPKCECFVHYGNFHRWFGVEWVTGTRATQVGRRK